MNQLDIEFGKKLRDQGIAQAVATAEDKQPDWKDNCYRHFENYLKTHPIGGEFMIEDFRAYMRTHLIEPPSNRAFGFLPKRAVKNGRIERASFAKVKNPTAHCAIVAVWRKIA